MLSLVIPSAPLAQSSRCSGGQTIIPVFYNVWYWCATLKSVSLFTLLLCFQTLCQNLKDPSTLIGTQLKHGSLFRLRVYF